MLERWYRILSCEIKTESQIFQENCWSLPRETSRCVFRTKGNTTACCLYHYLHKALLGQKCAPGTRISWSFKNPQAHLIMLYIHIDGRGINTHEQIHFHKNTMHKAKGENPNSKLSGRGEKKFRKQISWQWGMDGHNSVMKKVQLLPKSCLSWVVSMMEPILKASVV